MSSRGYQITEIQITLQPHKLERVDTLPTEEIARIVYLNPEKRAYLCIEQP